MRKIAAFVALGLGLALAITGAPAAQSQRAPAVYTAEIDGIIHPVAAEYMSETIAARRRRGRRADRVYAAHAGRPARFDARHQQRDHSRQDAGRGLRRARRAIAPPRLAF